MPIENELLFHSQKTESHQATIPLITTVYHRIDNLGHRSILFVPGKKSKYYAAAVGNALDCCLPPSRCFDNSSQSAIHLLPSLATMIVGLVLFGYLVRKTRCIPPWAIMGSIVASVRSGLCTTLTPDTSIGK